MTPIPVGTMLRTPPDDPTRTLETIESRRFGNPFSAIRHALGGKDHSGRGGAHGHVNAVPSNPVPLSHPVPVPFQPQQQPQYPQPSQPQPQQPQYPTPFPQPQQMQQQQQFQYPQPSQPQQMQQQRQSQYPQPSQQQSGSQPHRNHSKSSTKFSVKIGFEESTPVDDSENFAQSEESYANEEGNFVEQGEADQWYDGN